MIQINNVLPAFTGSVLTIEYGGVLTGNTDVYIQFNNAWGNGAPVSDYILCDSVTNKTITWTNSAWPLSFGQYYQIGLYIYISTTQTYELISNFGIIKYIAFSPSAISATLRCNTTTYNLEAIVNYTAQNLEYIKTLQFALYQNSESNLLEETEEILYNYTGKSLSTQSYVYTFQTYCPTTPTDYIVKIKYTTLNGYTDTYTTELKLQYNDTDAPDLDWQYTEELNNAAVSFVAPVAGALCKQNSNSYVFIKSVEENEKIIDLSLKCGNAQQHAYVIITQEDNNLSSSNAAITIPGTIYSYQSAINTVTYDHVYLSDKNGQLCLQFNPKVSNFKYTLQENKIETIGGQFPIIFRNGDVSYYEFTIGGLLSIQANNNDYNVVQQTPIVSFNTRGSTPSAIPQYHQNAQFNYNDESMYRNKIIKWLTNGKPKLYKSPTEGNYIVRLTNITLTPEEKLGRCLYSFSGTVTEIDEYNMSNLQKYDLLILNREEE